MIIIEAYYGLDEHIYQIDAGLLEVYDKPKDVKQYFECQVIPVKMLMTINIENSSLVLKRDDFKRTNKPKVFNPCINKSAKTLLYLKYTFQGLEKVLIYDFSREVLKVPHDCM